MRIRAKREPREDGLEGLERTCPAEVSVRSLFERIVCKKNKCQSCISRKRIPERCHQSSVRRPLCNLGGVAVRGNVPSFYHSVILGPLE